MKKMEFKLKKCPVCKSTRITKQKGIFHCKKCDYTNISEEKRKDENNN